MSSLAKKFPIDVHDSAVSGVACWSHLQSQTGGALEHWAIAFMPHHPYITEAGVSVSVSRLVVYNLQHLEHLLRNDTKEAERQKIRGHGSSNVSIHITPTVTEIEVYEG